jgi:hypothetical protein
MRIALCGKWNFSYFLQVSASVIGVGSLVQRLALLRNYYCLWYSLGKKRRWLVVKERQKQDLRISDAIFESIDLQWFSLLPNPQIRLAQFRRERICELCPGFFESHNPASLVVLLWILVCRAVRNVFRFVILHRCLEVRFWRPSRGRGVLERLFDDADDQRVHYLLTRQERRFPNFDSPYSMWRPVRSA